MNGVGVELNTASKQLLSYVSGLNAATAAAIVARRNEKGPFKSRADLKDPCRASAPRPSSRPLAFSASATPCTRSTPAPCTPSATLVVEKMAADHRRRRCADLIRDPKQLRAKIKLENYVTPEVGLPTLTDIMAELAKPGRDPREKFRGFRLLRRPCIKPERPEVPA